MLENRMLILFTFFCTTIIEPFSTPFLGLIYVKFAQSTLLKERLRQFGQEQLYNNSFIKYVHL